MPEKDKKLAESLVEASRALSDGKKELLTPDEVRALDNAILFIRGAKPVLDLKKE